MGGTSSVPVEAEKQTWIMPHRLEYNQVERERQLQVIDRLGPTLQLCSIQRSFGGVFDYAHWFVTDGDWFVEFGGGELGNCTVTIHNDFEKYSVVSGGRRKNQYVVHDNFSNTSDVKTRARAVCGASNYSLVLRNCEHLARYIHCGSWVSFQMASGGSPARDYFKSYLSSNHTKLINTLPDNLKEDPRLSEESLYPINVCRKFITYLNTAQVLNRYDDKCHSVLFLGPTGSGKSRLINLLFNREVSRSEPTALSVTKDVKFLQGQIPKEHTYFLQQSTTRTRENVLVNMIDTIGLCDSLMSRGEVYNWIKDRVKVNVMYLDVVVVVCSGRIERVQAEAIKQYMDWLRYSNFSTNFVFVYNKADGLTPAQKAENLGQMAELMGLKASTKMIVRHQDHIESVEDRLATSFPPFASWEDIQRDRKKFLDSVLFERPKRLEVDETWCNIL